MKKHDLGAQPVIRLANFWKSEIAPVCGGMTRPFRPKELGQLKMLLGRLGYWTPIVIGWVINNWAAFSKESQAAAGLGSAPPLPHVGFLLCHYHIAVELMVSAAKGLPEQSLFKTSVLEMKEELRKRLEEQLHAWAEAEDALEAS